MVNKKLEKILIADDNSQIRESLARNLFKDYDIDFASSAKEEIEKAKQNRYDLIVTDNQMPEEGEEESVPILRNGHVIGYNRNNDGIYAIKEIRKFDKKTPIIMYTSDKSLDIIIEALQEGANEFINKNIALDEFKKIIGKYLTNK